MTDQSAITLASTEAGKTFAPSFSLNDARSVYEGFGERRRTVICYLNERDAEATTKTKIGFQEISNAVDHCSAKLHFHDGLLDLEKRVGLYSLYQVFEAGHKPEGALRAALTYVFTGKKTEHFEPITEASLYEAAPPARPAPAPAPPYLGGSGVDKKPDDLLLNKEQLIQRAVSKIGLLNPTERAMLKFAAQGVVDAHIIFEVQKLTNYAEVTASVVRTLFRRISATLGIPNSYVYDDCRLMSVAAWRLSPESQEEEPTVDQKPTGKPEVKVTEQPLPVAVSEKPAITTQQIEYEVAAGVVVSGRLVTIPINRVRRFEGQPRTEFDEEGMVLLTGSMLQVGQLMPGLVRRVTDDPDHDYEIIDGERRWLSGKRSNKTHYEGIEYPGLSVPDAKKQYAVSAIANFGRSQHTPLELAYAVRQLMSDNGWNIQQVSAALCLGEATIRYHLRLLKLAPEAQALMRVTVPEKQRLTIAHALLLVDYPLEFQVKVATELSEQGMAQSKANWHVRQQAVLSGVQANRSRRGRRPANDARTVFRGIQRIDTHLDQYIHLPGLSLVDIFRRRSASERTEVSALLDEAIKKLQTIRSAVNGERSE